MSVNDSLNSERKVHGRRPLHVKPMESKQHHYSTRSKSPSQPYGWRTTSDNSSQESENSENEEENNDQLPSENVVKTEKNSSTHRQIGFESYIPESSNARQIGFESYIPESNNAFSDHLEKLNRFVPTVSHVQEMHAQRNLLQNEKSYVSVIFKYACVLILFFAIVSSLKPENLLKSENTPSSFEYDDSVNVPSIQTLRWNYKRRPYEHEIWLKNDLKEASADFPSQRDSIWPDLNAGIKKVLAEIPSSPSSFVFIHDDKGKNTAFCIVQRIAQIATKYLYKEKLEPIFLNSDVITKAYRTRDSGTFIKDYVKPVNESGVMVVMELEKLSGHLAQAFHHFCDEIVPLVPEAVYFFTLTVPNTRGIRPVKAAEDKLYSLWGKELNIDDVLAPLVTRITGSVISILPEPRHEIHLPPCELKDRYRISVIDREEQKLFNKKAMNTQ